MAKHTQTICRQITNELFERVWPLCEIGVNISLIIEVEFVDDPLLLRKKPTNKNKGKIPADSHNVRLLRISYL